MSCPQALNKSTGRLYRIMRFVSRVCSFYAGEEQAKVGKMKKIKFYTPVMLLFFQNFSKLGENLTLKKLVL